MDLYREQILEHWQNPQNFGVISDADLVIEQVNPLCGDEVMFYFKFEKKSQKAKELKSESLNEHSVIANGFDKLTINSMRQSESGKGVLRYNVSGNDMVIADVKFSGSGCAISIASASILSENIRNKKVAALSEITGEDVLELLGGPVAPARLRCAFLALEAVRRVNNEV